MIIFYTPFSIFVSMNAAFILSNFLPVLLMVFVDFLQSAGGFFFQTLIYKITLSKNFN